MLNAALTGRPLFDSIYLWIVTFTTVGFGDVLQPLDVQVDWALPLLVYRIFGLAMLAGVIDSLMDYVDDRKAEVAEKKRLLMQRSSLKFSSFRGDPKRHGSTRSTPPSRPPLPNMRRSEAVGEQKLPLSLADLGDDGFFTSLQESGGNTDRSFHGVKTFDARVHEPVFGDGDETYGRNDEEEEDEELNSDASYESEETGESSYA
jgi:Ion channel.